MPVVVLQGTQALLSEAAQADEAVFLGQREQLALIPSPSEYEPGGQGAQVVPEAHQQT